MQIKRKNPIIFIIILAVISAILIYIFVLKYSTYKILDDTPYKESIEIDDVIYQRSYWRADVFDKLIGFADSPEWGIYRSSDSDYSDFIVLKYHYSLDYKPQPIMFKSEDSTVLEPCAANTTLITFSDHINPSKTLYDEALIDDIFSALDMSDCITVSEISTNIKHYGSIDLQNDKLARLTFDLELILCKDVETYYLGIYNQNKLVPIHKELGKELRGYLK